MSNAVIRTERGWPAHFIGAANCFFRRNTLLECGEERIVVSTVGSYRPSQKDLITAIGAFGRYYETMVFAAQKDGPYWEANVSDQKDFDSTWQISAERLELLPDDVDNRANDMHEAVVSEFTNKMAEEVK